MNQIMDGAVEVGIDQYMDGETIDYMTRLAIDPWLTHDKPYIHRIHHTFSQRPMVKHTFMKRDTFSRRPVINRSPIERITHLATGYW